MKLSAQLNEVAKLSEQERDAMFGVMDRHYANVQRSVFDEDLDDKRWVIQIFEPSSGQLCGFSTQRLLELKLHGETRPIKALFSGDTIIDREHWGDQALVRAWAQLAFSLIDANPDVELYWFLISQGYKTYRYLPLFFHEFYPRYDSAMPSTVASVIDALAMSRYPNDYEPTTRIIRANSRQYRLRAGIADITSERLADPHVRFFQTRNPGHALGDELCCLASLTYANFTDAGYRVVGSKRGVLANPQPLEAPRPVV